MINWNRFSVDQIRDKWDLFIDTRKKYNSGIPKKHEKCHITCLEREALINQLLWRLDMANGVIDSYNKLRTCIEKDREKDA